MEVPFAVDGMLSAFVHAVGFGALDPDVAVAVAWPAVEGPPPEEAPESAPPEPEPEPESDEAPDALSDLEPTRITFVPISAPTTAPAVTRSTRIIAIQIPKTQTGISNLDPFLAATREGDIGSHIGLILLDLLGSGCFLAPLKLSVLLSGPSMAPSALASQSASPAMVKERVC